MNAKVTLRFMAMLFLILVPSITLLMSGIGQALRMYYAPYFYFYFVMHELYRIVLLAFLSVLPTVIYIWQAEKMPTWVLQRLLHVLLTAGLVFGMLYYYGWIHPETWWMIFAFTITVTIVANFFFFVRTKRLAKQLTQHLHIMNRGIKEG